MNVIPIQEALQKKEAVFFDTRSPAEYAEDHLPNAVNIPMFSNEERAIVGTIYKQVSQEKAIEQGIEFFSKNLPGLMKIINQYKDKELIIYCWRGGMRSRAVVALLETLKYKVAQLQGGHKAFRAYVKGKLDQFQLKPKIVVLWGLTCTGKTAILQKFPNSLDLEGLAQHRGSLYGAMGLIPNSQKKFDHLVLERLEELQKEEVIVVEGESRRIGDIMIPEFLYKAMLKGKHLLIKRSVEKRAEHCVQEYMKKINIEEMRAITISLQRVISNKQKEKMVQCLDKGEYQEAATILLVDYYDPLYAHTLKQIQFRGEISAETTEEGVEKVKRLINDRKAFIEMD